MPAQRPSARSLLRLSHVLHRSSRTRYLERIAICSGSSVCFLIRTCAREGRSHHAEAADRGPCFVGGSGVRRSIMRSIRVASGRALADQEHLRPRGEDLMVGQRPLQGSMQRVDIPSRRYGHIGSRRPVYVERRAVELIRFDASVTWRDGAHPPCTGRGEPGTASPAHCLRTGRVRGYARHAECSGGRLSI